MTPSGIIRWGGIAAMLGGALWVVWGLLSRAIPYAYAAGGPSYGGLLRLSAGLLLLATLLMLGGLVGLDALEAGSYWNLGRVGFYTAGVGLLAQALAASFLLFGSEALLWLLTPGGSLAVVVGLALYGAATLRARVLARWCGWALIVVPPIAWYLNSKEFYGSIALFGVLWVALGYVLWSRRGAPSRQRPSRVW
jgi:hypothetical protein